jgi:hypothetical protein
LPRIACLSSALERQAVAQAWLAARSLLVVSVFKKRFLLLKKDNLQYVSKYEL